jgi:hypothetical protein
MVLLTFLRGASSFALVLVGAALSLFSVLAAFGWGHAPTSLASTVVAILGLTLMFGGYWLVRNTDGALLAAVCLKVALGLGSMLLVVGLLAVVISGDPLMPTGYFIAVGCLCLLGFVKFRTYTKEH